MLAILSAQADTTEEYTFVTLAGPPEAGFGAIDGTGSAARFSQPRGVAVDSAGNVYVVDLHTIRIGALAFPDAPTVDLAVAPAGVTRQLDTRPQTAVSWQWS